MKYLSAFRCAGREVDQGRCCSEAAPCVAGEGDCDGDQECEAGLVCGEVDGPRRCYCINPEGLAEAKRLLREL